MLHALPVFPFSRALPDWLTLFHEGERAVLTRVYQDEVRRVLAAAAKVVGEADAESVAHDVFYKLLSDTAFRAAFTGGNVGAWLSTVARNSALDMARRRARETALPESERALPAARDVRGEVDADLFVRSFLETVLPADLKPLFDLRFLEQRSQRDAAAMLDMPRTTLVYQEQRIRELLQSYAKETRA